MSKLDLTKPIVSRGGHPVRIVCSDMKGERPIIALHQTGDTEIALMHTLDGIVQNGGYDSWTTISNAPEHDDCFTTFHGCSAGQTYNTLAQARSATRHANCHILKFVLIDGIPCEPRFVKPDEIA